MIDEAFQAQFVSWTREMRGLAQRAPWAGIVAGAMELWYWTFGCLLRAEHSDGAPIYREARQPVAFSMADCLGRLLAVRALAWDVSRLGGGRHANVGASGTPSVGAFYCDLAAIQAAHVAGRVAQVCTGLLFGQEAALPGGLRETFAALRARLYVSLSGLAPVRDRAAEFIRTFDVAGLERLSDLRSLFLR
jgi:hypothetical protein